MKKMTLRTLLITLTAFCSSAVIAQSHRVAGKVLNDKNEPLAGVSVKAANGAGTSTNMDGVFQLTLAEGSHELAFTAVGYDPKLVSVSVPAAQELLVLMSVAAKDLNNIVITASRSNARRESVNALLQYQKNTNTVASVISAEAIRRSPDKNTGEVLKRVPGTSIQEGKYLVVRGLADRYNQAMLNGILLSSTEPDRKTFSFDLFPAPMVDNIIINKAFVPELPGEWAGGLVQVQTKEIPTRGFLNVQVGTGFNSETIGRPFYSYSGGKLDWLGIEDGTRRIPSGVPSYQKVADMTPSELNAIGSQFRNVWAGQATEAPLNKSFQMSSGFSSRVFDKKFGGTVSLIYNQSNRRLQFDNAIIANNEGNIEVKYHNERHSTDVMAGAMANLSLQLNNNNRISFKNILNVNTSDFNIRRTGRDFILGPGIGDQVRAEELGFRQNTFLNSQLIGEHNISGLRLKWYGGYNVLDQYVPDQRRLFYVQDGSNPNGPFEALLSSGAGASQKSGSLFYSFLNDHIYNAGTDVSRSFRLNGRNQTVKAGYYFQIKDRDFNSRPFYINTSSTAVKRMGPDRIFSRENFQNGSIQFGELSGLSFRYMANTILNAGYLQFDNQVGEDLRVIWGVRVEDFDQLVGSPRTSDPRHVYTRVRDFLPGVNITYKPGNNSNIRLSGSQTVVRPEFRELSPFAFYDFELNAQVVGNNRVQRTKISNFDLRYETYPKSGEVISFGVFYKHFNNPIEYYFNRTGPATNTFNVANTTSAKAFGAEFEFRKKLDFVADVLKNFTLTGNTSYIYSRVKDTAELNRPLQGQSPYLVNAGLQYDAPKLGLNTTLLFNQIGRRILFVGDKSVTDIWENPRPLLDWQIAKKILDEKAEVRLNVSDIFNRRAFFYHDLDENQKFGTTSRDVLAISRNYGTNYSITFSYNIK